MKLQPKALRLADELEMWTKGEPAAEELRRLHEVNTELLEALRGAIRDAEYIGSDGWMTGLMHSEEYKAAVAAIAKATGGAA